MCENAEEFAAQADMSPKDMIRETGFIKPGDTVGNIGNSPQFEEGVADSLIKAMSARKTPIPKRFRDSDVIENASRATPNLKT